REAARRIAAAERPVLYVGGGVLNADACPELLELAEIGRLPVVTTLMAKSGFPESHELHFGWPGMHGPKWSNWAMNKCDVLVAVGARFDDRVTGKLAAFAPGATVVHLDVDSAEIDKLRYADVPVVGPLKSVLAELAHELGDHPRTFITSGGLGTMGYGLPAAVGAKAARPEATVVCIDGDGCFQMTCQELATSVLENLPIVVVIVNNGYLGMVRQWQDMFFE